MSEKTYDRVRAAAIQRDYCRRRKAPCFVSSGACIRCGRNIYDPIRHKNGCVTGISVEEAGTHMITGCPHCNASFVD